MENCDTNSKADTIQLVYDFSNNAKSSCSWSLAAASKEQKQESANEPCRLVHTVDMLRSEILRNRFLRPTTS